MVFYDVDPAVKVTEVEPGSAAALAGIEPGDVIVEANGIASPPSQRARRNRAQERRDAQAHGRRPSLATEIHGRSEAPPRETMNPAHCRDDNHGCGDFDSTPFSRNSRVSVITRLARGRARPGGRIAAEQRVTFRWHLDSRAATSRPRLDNAVEPALDDERRNRDLPARAV